MANGRGCDADAIGSCVGVIAAFIFLRTLKHIHLEVKSDVGAIAVFVLFVFVFQYGAKRIAGRTAQPKE